VKLHEALSDFIDLIRLTAQDLKIREVYVEKDYWVIFVLKRLSQHAEREHVVFKGGTSLSKAYKLVHRFSEDVDLAVIKGQATKASIERLIKSVAKDITAAPLVEVTDPQVTSKKGQSRRTLHRYPRHLAEEDFGQVRKEILLEMNCFGEPHPNAKIKIASYIAEFLEKIDRPKDIFEFGLEPFEVLVLDKRTTFVEKVLSLAYASFADGNAPMKEVRERVRHFYDLTLILGDPAINNFLGNGDFVELLRKIRAEEKLASRIKWVDRRLGECRLISKTEEQLKEVEGYFRADLEPMLFSPEALPKFADVAGAFRKISKMIRDADL